MLVSALILTMAASALYVGLSRRMRRRRRAASTGFMTPTPHFNRFDRTPEREAAHATVPGAIALNSSQPARVRPGHRCMEEIRRRSHVDFVGALTFFEGQLHRRVSESPLEQVRYWMDLAEGMRNLNMHEAVPALLRRIDEALDLPSGEGFAVEVVSFPSFAEFLHDPLSREGQAGLRALRVVMEGIRMNRIPVGVYAEAAFGDAIRRLAENCPDATNPRLALVFIEAMRHCRQTYHTAPAFRDDPVRRQTVRWQNAFMRDAEAVMREYLHDLGVDMVRMLPAASGRGIKEILQAINELHIDSDEAALALLAEPDFPYRSEAISCLRWSRSAMTSSLLCALVTHATQGGRTPKWLRRLGVGQNVSSSADVETCILALRGHPGEETEKVLLACVVHPDVAWRQGALRSLGWWEPVRRAEVLGAIRVAKQDSQPQVRRAALAAAARLGECSALQTLREMLTRENLHQVQDAIQLCKNEGLSWLWPDLDLLTETDNPHIVSEAWEAIERIREEFMGPIG
ncbi:HEAT repeat domain-containing protein [Zavarzinella formosa]|uniref:HEAT repeat domain-containing protein n=1 Tax=Zavarzinella formosa TaxID=360055 RepID=UPI000380A933|nr:HEAT repeat domain-containing protein [Zavarzinella formosa]